MNRRALSIEEWEEICGRMPIRRMRPRTWPCPRCKLGVSTQGELCEMCEADIATGDANEPNERTRIAQWVPDGFYWKVGP